MMAPGAGHSGGRELIYSHCTSISDYSNMYCAFINIDYNKYISRIVFLNWGGGNSQIALLPCVTGSRTV
jgi:hypothetical protein